MIPKHFITLLCTFFVTASFSILKAQVTIGANSPPHAEALLDLKENSAGTSTKGLLLPRVELASATNPSPFTNHVEGMFVYNTKFISAEFDQGIYYNNGTSWVHLSPIITGGGSPSTDPGFFYMPSMILPTKTSAPEYNSADQTFTIDLYSIYASQFGLTNTTSSLKSPGASSLSIPASNSLEYFIIYYDNAVFTNVSLTNTGILKYKLVTGFIITEKTYMNIVFKTK